MKFLETSILPHFKLSEALPLTILYDRRRAKHQAKIDEERAKAKRLEQLAKARAEKAKREQERQSQWTSVYGVREIGTITTGADLQRVLALQKRHQELQNRWRYYQ